MTLDDWREKSAHELIAFRFAAGRRERGLTTEPFRFDHPELGVDELEELVDRAIYMRERYRVWYGEADQAWPVTAHLHYRAAIAAIEELRTELKNGPRKQLAIVGKDCAEGGL